MVLAGQLADDRHGPVLRKFEVVIEGADIVGMADHI